MDKTICVFLKDKLMFTLVYFINTFTIILFFYLYRDKPISFGYPVLLSIYIYVLFLIFSYIKYYKFNKSIKKASRNINIDIYARTYEQREVKKLLNKTNEIYTNRINLMKEKNKVNNKFFSQWVHNMKTPVSIIEILIEKITEKISNNSFSKDNNIKQILNLINELREENNKILIGLDQILNMIRIEDFSKDYIPEDIDLYDSLIKVINERKNQFIYNNVFPKVLIEASNEKILTDEKWNKFMIGQIISNAIKYSRDIDESKSTGKYVFFNIKKEEKYVVLTIRDEGIGIPDYDVNKVLEPFFTGENGRKFKNSTGIGLYICKIICEKLGHDIYVESDLGKGTSITIKYLSKL
ncbi:sensor histidine kinase [Clostridium oceanicum]|uniref:histidine kinase n=1 Tax=Clostridium oceanicum TaxID=1543 RepID=A0ABN1JJ88_9CLOT